MFLCAQPQKVWKVKRALCAPTSKADHNYNIYTKIAVVFHSALFRAWCALLIFFSIHRNCSSANYQPGSVSTQSAKTRCVKRYQRKLCGAWLRSLLLVAHLQDRCFFASRTISRCDRVRPRRRSCRLWVRDLLFSACRALSALIYIPPLPPQVATVSPRTTSEKGGRVTAARKETLRL